MEGRLLAFPTAPAGPCPRGRPSTSVYGGSSVSHEKTAYASPRPQRPPALRHGRSRRRASFCPNPDPQAVTFQHALGLVSSLSTAPPPGPLSPASHALAHPYPRLSRCSLSFSLCRGGFDAVWTGSPAGPGGPASRRWECGWPAGRRRAVLLVLFPPDLGTQVQGARAGRGPLGTVWPGEQPWRSGGLWSAGSSGGGPPCQAVGRGSGAAHVGPVVLQCDPHADREAPDAEALAGDGEARAGRTWAVGASSAGTTPRPSAPSPRARTHVPSLRTSSRPSSPTPVPQDGLTREQWEGSWRLSRGNRKAPRPVAGRPPCCRRAVSSAGLGGSGVGLCRGSCQPRSVLHPPPPSACGPPRAAPRSALSPCPLLASHTLAPPGRSVPACHHVGSSLLVRPHLRDTSRPRQAPGAVAPCPLRGPLGWLWAPRALPGSPRLLTRDPGFQLPPRCPGVRGAWGLRLGPGRGRGPRAPGRTRRVAGGRRLAAAGRQRRRLAVLPCSRHGHRRRSSRSPHARTRANVRASGASWKQGTSAGDSASPSACRLCVRPVLGRL